MENENKIRQTINGLRKYQEVISDLIQILESQTKKHPSGSATPPPPEPPNDRILREDGKGLIKPNNWKK